MFDATRYICMNTNHYFFSLVNGPAVYRGCAAFVALLSGCCRPEWTKYCARSGLPGNDHAAAGAFDLLDPTARTKLEGFLEHPKVMETQPAEKIAED